MIFLRYYKTGENEGVGEGEGAGEKKLMLRVMTRVRVMVKMMGSAMLMVMATNGESKVGEERMMMMVGEVMASKSNER